MRGWIGRATSRKAESLKIMEKKFFLPLSILGWIYFFSLDNETVRPVFSDSWNRLHNLPEQFEAKVAAFFLFFFYFYFGQIFEKSQ